MNNIKLYLISIICTLFMYSCGGKDAENTASPDVNLNESSNGSNYNLTQDSAVEKNLPENETQTNQNINKRLTKLTTFGHWCIKQGLISSNPFKDMKLSVRKTPPKKRVPFSVKELREILKPEIYLDWTINYKHPIYNEGGCKEWNALLLDLPSWNPIWNENKRDVPTQMLRYKRRKKRNVVYLY